MNVDFSVENITSSVFDNFKKLTPALLAVCVFTGLILFLPDSILKQMSLNELPSTWRMIIGIIFLFCLAMIITIIISSIIGGAFAKRRFNRFKENQKKKIKRLSYKQIEILRQLLHSEDKAIRLDKNSGDTIYLLSNLFIHQPNQMVSIGWDNEMLLWYVPEPWLLDLYNEEPEILS